MIIGKFSIRIVIMTILKMIGVFVFAVLTLTSSIIILAFAYDYYKTEQLNFQVFGEDELLQNSKVIITSRSYNKLEPVKIEHLLYLGKKYKKRAPYGIRFLKIPINIDNASIPAAIYISYKDELVYKIELPDWYKFYHYVNDVNHIYLFRTNNTIKFSYITKEKDLELIRGSGDGGITLIAKEEFYQKNNISPQEIGKYEMLFFNNFPKYLPRKNVYSQDLKNLKDVEIKINNLTTKNAEDAEDAKTK